MIRYGDVRWNFTWWPLLEINEKFSANTPTSRPRAASLADLFVKCPGKANEMLRKVCHRTVH